MQGARRPTRDWSMCMLGSTERTAVVELPQVCRKLLGRVPGCGEQDSSATPPVWLVLRRRPDQQHFPIPREAWLLQLCLPPSLDRSRSVASLCRDAEVSMQRYKAIASELTEPHPPTRMLCMLDTRRNLFLDGPAEAMGSPREILRSSDLTAKNRNNLGRNMRVTGAPCHATMTSHLIREHEARKCTSAFPGAWNAPSPRGQESSQSAQVPTACSQPQRRLDLLGLKGPFVRIPHRRKKRCLTLPRCTRSSGWFVVRKGESSASESNQLAGWKKNFWAASSGRSRRLVFWSIDTESREKHISLQALWERRAWRKVSQTIMEGESPDNHGSFVEVGWVNKPKK